jgi:hypothetical protein
MKHPVFANPAHMKLAKKLTMPELLYATSFCEILKVLAQVYYNAQVDAYKAQFPGKPFPFKEVPHVWVMFPELLYTMSDMIHAMSPIFDSGSLEVLEATTLHIGYSNDRVS